MGVWMRSLRKSGPNVEDELCTKSIEVDSLPAFRRVRRVRRWLQPTGLFIVVMGPDGAGKSTLIEHLVQAVSPAFRRHRVFHWRPMLLWRRKAAGDTTQPHSHPPYAGWWSTARLFAHLLDYWLGYCLVIRPLLARSGLVVFDRYFHDLLADPKRYRFGGPLWLARSVSWLVPKPDLLFILDAPVQVILSRKQEVLPENVLSQRRVYLHFASSFSHSRVIDSTAPLARVVAEAGQRSVNTWPSVLNAGTPAGSPWTVSSPRPA